MTPLPLWMCHISACDREATRVAVHQRDGIGVPLCADHAYATALEVLIPIAEAGNEYRKPVPA